MSATETLPAPPAERWTPSHNPWVIALVVTMATFMEVLDTSIANVALPHMAGSLSAGTDESAWVLSSYLVANAIILPISAWLATRYGRKRFYMTCVVLFGVSSFLCGLAPSLSWLVFFRVLQGLGGGGLAPSEQAILADTFPPQKRGMAFAIYGMAVVLAPAIGPTLGGYITDNFNWRWIFYINVPVAILSLILSSRFVEDPPFLKTMRERAGKVDYVGLGLIAIGLGSAQVVLDKGQRDDWFASNFILIFSICAVIGIIGAVIWEYYQENPVIDVHLFRNRNFFVSCVLMFMLGAALFGATVLLPQMVQTLMGYTAEQAGWVLSPGAVVIIILLPFVGKMVSKIDPRYMIAFGFVAAGIALLYMTEVNQDMDFKTIVMMRIYQMAGVAFLFVPIQTLCYVGIPMEKNNNISGMINLARNMGGSIGIAGLETILARRQQFHQSVLAAHTSQFDAPFQATLHSITAAMQNAGYDLATATQMAYTQIYGMVQGQAAWLAYIDTIYLYGLICLSVAPLAFLMQRPKKGGGPGAIH
ncbi:MAG TPA: DHA2 family efflux MFS transporter permease subunit [Bryobacteraceae bacterium]|nr:DHA2 family efflux MFS transporter permease subunit [Bryobacteraceae bacterium]